MADISKVLYMTFATSEGGTFKIAVDNTRDDLDKDEVAQVMDNIIMTKVFATNKGQAIRKTKAYFVTEQVEELDI